MKKFIAVLTVFFGFGAAIATFDGVLEAELANVYGVKNASLSMFRLPDQKRITVVSTLTDVPLGRYAVRLYDGRCQTKNPKPGQRLSPIGPIGTVFKSLKTLTVSLDTSHGYKTIAIEQYTITANLDSFLNKVAVIVDLNPKSIVFNKAISCGGLSTKSKENI